MERDASPVSAGPAFTKPLSLSVYLGDDASGERVATLFKLRKRYREAMADRAEYLGQQIASLMLQGLAEWGRLQREAHYHAAAEIADKVSTNDHGSELFAAHFAGHKFPHPVKSMTERELFEYAFWDMEISWADVCVITEGCRRIKDWFEGHSQ